MHCLICPSRRRGFSFTEVLFAVVILGIGFIMIAAIFPVAIQQSKLTIDETTGAAIARGSVNYLHRAMSDNADGLGAANSASSNCRPLQEGVAPNFYAVTQQLSYTMPTADTSLITALRGSQIIPEDPRYAFIGLYRRAGLPATPNPAAQVYVFAVQATVGNIFKPGTAVQPADARPPTATLPENNLMAHEVEVAIAHKVAALGDIDLIAFNTACTSGNATQNLLRNYNVGAGVEGGYVVIASDRLTGNNQGRMNGRVYKLGARRSDLDSDFRSYFPAASYSTLTACQIYELDPSNNFSVDGGGDGIVKRYATPANSPLKDDIIGLGNTGPLSELLPQSSSVSTPTSVEMMTVVSTNTAFAYVIGRSYADPGNPNGGFDGNCMVVGLYTTFVKIN